MKNAIRAGLGASAEPSVRLQSCAGTGMEKESRAAWRANELASHRGHARAQWMLVSLLAVTLALSAARGLAAEVEVSSPGNSPVEVWLEHRETTNSVAHWGFNVTKESKAFSKEPDIGTRKVARGSLDFGGFAGQEIPFLWDYREGKLYLDLNRNRDLTDDPEGAFSTAVTRFSYYSQVYTNVRVLVKTAAGTFPLCLDLDFYGPERPQIFGSIMCRSIWEGKIALAGRDWQIGRIDGEARAVGEKNRGHLLLRPWAERDQPFEVQGGRLDAFSFAQNVFFAGQAYRLACEPVEQNGKVGYKLNIRQTSAALGELNVTGKFIHRLLLAAGSARQNEDRYTVVLDRPEGAVKVPVGDYDQLQVQLQSGKLNVFREPYGQLSRPSISVAIGSPRPPELAAGGPLSNSVSASRRGRDLSLQYQLLGADGARYSVVDQDRSHPPQFAISKNGKQIHSGVFEYG